ncbi:hypothetical protein JG687_00015216 [Phytophthora cactorum]|uniref:Uncharacterized protein n=1 Tax=Phytophthora cactorum TaxID=29920 RepID=A0A8T1TWI9_9STRA|nr:hypothetical protein JG687_00015216 [Phytophthora cactorum]
MIAELTDSLGQVVTAAFDWERRSPRRASTILYSDRGIYLRDGSPLQVNHVEFTLYTGTMMADFSAIMSAMAINQTVKKFSIRGEKRAVTHADQWKWLAYGLFSKRARAYSALDVAALNQGDSLSDIDMEAFLSVLNSHHPEESFVATLQVLLKNAMQH